MDLGAKDERLGKRLTIIGASVSEPPLVDSTDALSCDIYVRHPILRMRGATRKRSRPDRESSQSS